jgi:hypothetical protein
LPENLEGKPTHRWKIIGKVLRKIGCEDKDWIRLPRIRSNGAAFVRVAMNLQILEMAKHFFN